MPEYEIGDEVLIRNRNVLGVVEEIEIISETCISYLVRFYDMYNGRETEEWFFEHELS